METSILVMTKKEWKKFGEEVLYNAWIKEQNRRKALPLCDKDCNNCPLLLHDNSRMLTKIFNLLYEKFGEEAYKIIQEHCPNLTVCFDCRIDDFCHFEGCTIVTPSEEQTRD